jgi:hypothetical protein
MMIINGKCTTYLYTNIFGQHDPRKTPMGKTSEEHNLLWSLKGKIQQILQPNLSQDGFLNSLEICAWDSLKNVPLLCNVGVSWKPAQET